MKRKIVLIASLACGLLAAVLTRVYIMARESSIEADRKALRDRFGTIEVVVFKHDVPSGAVLTKSDVGICEVLGRNLAGQAVEKFCAKDILGRKLGRTRKAGEVLFWMDLEGGDLVNRGLSSDIKRQMRAVSINCSGAASVSGMVLPNDHVDVIGTFAFPQSNGHVNKGDIITCTILQNVLVLATGKETAKSRVGESLSPQGYSTVTLEVTPREAEMLAFAEQMKGRLVLTLRNRNDTSYEKELPKVDFDKIKNEIEELNQRRQQKIGGR